MSRTGAGAAGVRWVAWTSDAVKARLENRLASLGASTTAMECILTRPGTYATKAHALPPGSPEPYGGPGGQAVCGTAVPADHPDVPDPAVWWDETEVAKCKRCRAALRRQREEDR